MDFQNSYSEDQEQFRKEVRAWLQENVPESMKLPTDRAEFNEEMCLFWHERHKELGAKGWLYPTFPKEYGGGGLTAEHETILEEEFQLYRAPTGSFTADFVLPSLLVWGTEEQKQKFLAPILKGAKNAWQKFTEPKSGADLASYQSTAVRDGDEWILNGSNVFCSTMGGVTPDWIYGPMLTDPDAPRHRNLGYFMIPCPTPGLEIRRMNLLNGDDQCFVFLDNVRVTTDHLIGGDHDGWQVANTSLEKEHGGNGRAFPTDTPINNLVEYMQQRRKNNKSGARETINQQMTASAYIESQVNSLLEKRTYWMYQNGLQMTWEGPLTALHTREYNLRNVARIRNVMEMYTLLGTKDPTAPHNGAQEVQQRWSFIHQHGAGSLNINKVVVARRIGISRTKEKPAPTPTTAKKSS